MLKLGFGPLGCSVSCSGMGRGREEKERAYLVDAPRRRRTRRRPSDGANEDLARGGAARPAVVARKEGHEPTGEVGGEVGSAEREARR